MQPLMEDPYCGEMDEARMSHLIRRQSKHFQEYISQNAQAELSLSGSFPMTETIAWLWNIILYFSMGYNSLSTPPPPPPPNLANSYFMDEWLHPLVLSRCGYVSSR